MFLYNIYMSDPCNDVYNFCNLLIINISWYAEQLYQDVTRIKEDLLISYNDMNNSNNQMERPTILKPFHYSDDEKVDYLGDEDWLESWDRV